MGELNNPIPKLPKNIRQIGDKDDVVKLYLEDYVNTYLKRLYPAGGQDLRVGILLGTTETYEGIPYIFIDGALEMEDVTAVGEKVTFSEAAWKKAYQSIDETFPKRTVQGWFICGAPGCILSPLNYWKQHNQYFGGKNQLMYLNSGIDGEEAVYVTSEEGFYRLNGYSVYYERNQMMQDYMILRKDVHRVETGANDRVIRDFRNRMEGRKQEAVSRRGTIRVLGTLCSMLTVAVLAGGVVMFNNYQKMREMEGALVSVLPEGIRGERDSADIGSGDSIVVEEIQGNVYPTTNYNTAVDETITVTPSSNVPESAGETVGQAVPESSTSQESSQPSSSPEPAVTKAPEVLPEPEAINEIPPVSSESGGNSTASKDLPVTNMKPGETYIIGEGETLFGICFEKYGHLNYLDDICALNSLSDVNKIIAGQELVLPDLSGAEG